ncbi:uncharacterized protein LOC113384701 [Ctenocephalides felis]|uniref:uncharacterized protein LOC113384701 n=1 Tax=Ctenocephalides felis TaxID=7515 RepID=UPI000E6E4A97|nr:uncharacterized protein LOC113384701 [Ctenocephalides felis]
MNRMKEYTKWEESMKPLFGFIQLKSKPSIYYKPKVMNDATNTLLKESNEQLECAIDKKRQEVYSELEEIESKIMGNYLDESFTSKDRDNDDNMQNDTEANESQEMDISTENNDEHENESTCDTSQKLETAEHLKEIESSPMKNESNNLEELSENSDKQPELETKEENSESKSDTEC